jgi:hypothetical protein
MFINEIRIPLSAITQLDVLQCSTSSLSSRHKKAIERSLNQQDWIAIFEGDVLFVIPKITSDLPKEIDVLRSALVTLNLQYAASHNLRALKLKQAPQRVIERITFAILSYQARKHGIFSLFGRTFLKPTTELQKLAHRSVETTLTTDNGFLKIYLTPSLVALTNIEETYREKLPDIELINLCKYRIKASCELATGDGSCPFVTPSTVGYFDKLLPLDSLDDSEKLVFRNRYRGCPKIESVSKVILAKATKKAKKYTVFPPYVIFAGISKEDLHSKPAVLRQYREATLMASSKRWHETIKWIKDIFGIEDTDLPSSINIEYGDLKIPFQIILLSEIKASASPISGYRSIVFPNQKVVNEQNNPIAKSYGGGWLFSTQGAFDRESIDRPFDTIKPYLVVPNISNVPDLSRQLMEILSDGEYKVRTPQGDQEFFGINHPNSQSKYHAKFINPWKEEDGIYLLPDAEEATYKNCLQDIKREWNSHSQRDMNRLAFIITPTSKLEENELYYKLKKILFEEGIPSQFVSITTLNKLGDPKNAFGPTLHSLWLNIYAKMGGKPWRLATQMENVHCFIGVGFGMNNAKERGKHIFAGFAHIFDKFGNWIDIASGSQTITDEDHESFYEPQKYLQGTSSFKISKNLTQEVIYNALRLYQQQQTQTGEAARNIVLHKLGPIYECEVIGFLEGIRQLIGTMGNCRLGIVQIEQDHQIKLYGPASKNHRADRTVSRGFSVFMSNNTIALASTGCVDRGKKGLSYFGIGTPQPLLITSVLPSKALMQQYGLTINNFYSVESLTKHIMALTQLHWGSTRDNIRLPITGMYAQKVADLISKTDASVDTWESYHRPWFL